MAIILGEFPNTVNGGFVNDRLTPALQGFAIDYSPAHEAEIERAGKGSLVAAFPVSAAPRAISGVVQHHFFDDFYNRLHIVPRRLDLGNVASTQVSEVAVWNAFLAPLTLNGINGIQAGIEVSGPIAFPLPFEPLREESWQVAVSNDGSPTIDITLTWDFDASDVSLPITANRITAWPFLTDWSSSVRERLLWKTSILPSESAASQRRQVRLSPRRAFTAQYLVSGRERTLFDLAMHGWGGRVWAMPIAPDIQLLQVNVDVDALSIPCVTAGRDFQVGGLALLRGDDAFHNEALEIQAVLPGSLTLVRPTQFAWPAGSRLYPVKAARLNQQPDVTRLTDRDMRASADFVVVESNDWPASVLPLYRGYGVYDNRPDEGENLSRTWARLQKTLDNVSGIPSVVDTADVGLAVQMHRWLLDSIDSRTDWRSLIYALKGAQVPVWIPSHADDIRLTAIVSSVATSLQIEEIGYTRFANGQPGRSDIRIELLDGTVFYRHITGAAEVDPDMEALLIDAPLGVAVAPDDVFRISFMALMQGEDTIEIEHVTDVQGTAVSQMIFQTVRDDDL